MTDVLGGVRSRVDDGEASGHDPEKEGHGDAGDRGDVQLLDEERSLVVEDVDEVHVEVPLAEAVVQVLAALEQTEEDGAGRLVARLAHGRGLNPVIGSEAA